MDGTNNEYINDMKDLVTESNIRIPIRYLDLHENRITRNIHIYNMMRDWHDFLFTS